MIILKQKKIIGKNSKDIKNILGYEGRDELIHKDDLVKITTNINKNSCPEHINFHCHSKFSDGSLEPEELLDQVFFNKLIFSLVLKI